MEAERYKMVQECVDSYHFKDKKDGGAEITIVTSKRFANLWLEKLTSLETSDEEIAEFEPDD